MLILGTVVFGVTLLAAEVGYRFGWRRRTQLHPEERAQHQTMQSALLGLLALLLGFSFAMAESRFDARKALVFEEANAIGTAALRTALLPAPQGPEIRRILKLYVDARLALYRKSGFTVEDELRLVEPIETQAWPQAVEVARQDPRSVAAGLMLQSLNQVIDLNTTRIAVTQNHVPLTVLIVVLTVEAVALLWVGMGIAYTNQRNWLTILLLSLMIALVSAVIVDLDQPKLGLIRVSQASMEAVQRSLAR